MKTFTITYRTWNGENGNLETRTQESPEQAIDTDFLQWPDQVLSVNL